MTFLATRSCVAAFGTVGLVAVELHMLSQGARVGVTLVAAPDLAHVGFITGVHVRMFLSVAAVCKPPVASLELTLKRFFTCMSPLVNFQIFRSCKNLLTAVEGAGKGLFPCVDSDVIHQLVFGFERLPVPRTILPVAYIFRVLGSSDMLHCHMGDKFIHGPEGSGAGHLPSPLLAVTPLTHQLVLHCLFRTPEKSVASSTLDCHVQRFVQTQELCDKLLAVSLGADGLAIGVSPGEEVAR